MRRNIGKMDRFLRIMLSIPFLVYGVLHMSWIGLIGIVLLATAIFGYCGLYSLLGFDTCQSKDGSKSCEI